MITADDILQVFDDVIQSWKQDRSWNDSLPRNETLEKLEIMRRKLHEKDNQNFLNYGVPKKIKPILITKNGCFWPAYISETTLENTTKTGKEKK